MRTSIVALTLLLVGSAYAQTGAAPPDKAAHEAKMMDNLTVLLDLTDVQRSQVQATLEQQHAAMKAKLDAARASGTKPDWAAMKASHEQMEADTVAKLTPVLSAAQLKKFQVLEQMRDEHMHGEHMHHRGPPPGAPPPAQ